MINNRKLIIVSVILNICFISFSIFSIVKYDDLYRKVSVLTNNAKLLNATITDSSDISGQILLNENIPLGNADKGQIVLSNKQNDMYINVKNPPDGLPGAVGDGITDDTSAIQNIIDYCGRKGSTLYFPNGNYKVYGLVITNWMGIQGESKRNTTIVNYSTTNPCIKLSNNGELFTIRDIAIFGNGDGGAYGSNATSSCGILLDHVSSVNIDNVWMRRHGSHCIMATQSNINNINISNSDLGYSKGDGIRIIADSVSRKNAINITNCNISKCGGNGISVFGNSIEICNNTIQGNNGVGIYMGGSMVSGDYTAYSINIENNYFELDSGGFIKAVVSSSPDPVRVIVGLRIVGNFGIMYANQVDSGVNALVSFEYPQSYGQFAMLRDAVFDNPGFSSDKLKVLDAHNSINSDSVIKIPYQGNDTYVNMGYATVQYLKHKVLNGYFYAKGVEYDIITGKSKNITSSTVVYFPFDSESFGGLRDFYIYCETDSKNYSILVERFYRNKGKTSEYSSVIFTSKTNLSGSQLIGGNVSNYTQLVSENDIDQYFKITITLKTPRNYFYLGNPTYTTSQ